MQIEQGERMGNKFLEDFTSEVGGILLGAYTAEQDQAIVDWNIQRNQLKWDKQLEFNMLDEEIDEFFTAKALVDMMDAFVDTTFVLSGTVAKAKENDKIDEFKEIVTDLNLIEVMLKMYKIMTKEFNKRNRVEYKLFPEELLYEAFNIVIEANNQKLKVGKSGKVEKPEGFVKPEEKIYNAIKEFEWKMKGNNE